MIDLTIMAPVATRSGYGERSRDLIRSLISMNLYDIKIISTRWGSCPMNALSQENDIDLISRIQTSPMTVQPTIFMQVTIPSEFQAIGKFNIGVTAGIETTLADPSWIEGCNKMNLIIVSSEHAKKTFEQSVFEKRDQQGRSLGMLKLERPIEVIFEGVRTHIFSNKSSGSFLPMKEIKNSWNFLFVGHWLQGNFGEDRKNVSGLIKTFLETFKNKKNAPGLILKTSGGSLSIMDKVELENKINQIKATVKDAKSLPNIYLLYGDLTEQEMNSLYNHPKVMSHVSFTKGEGFGRPLIEAACSGKPVIVSGWSGQLDFLDPETSILVSGKLTNVHTSAAWKGVLNTDAQWFTIDYSKAGAYMKDVFENYKHYQEKSRKTSHFIKTNFSFDSMTEKLKSLMQRCISEQPQEVKLNLPKLRKVGDIDEPQKITLPKLKKI